MTLSSTRIMPKQDFRFPSNDLGVIIGSQTIVTIVTICFGGCDTAGV